MTFGTGESLNEIVRRAKLPLSIRYSEEYDVFGVGRTERYMLPAYPDSMSARKAYFDLVSTFPATSSPAGSSESCSANSGPPSGVGT